MRRLHALLAPTIPLFLALTASAQAPIDPTQAATAFAEARNLSDRDAGKLWHTPLYGPILFVDPETNTIATNVLDGNSTLHADHGIFIGALPKNFPVANTAVQWSGTYWTMILWPLPTDSLARQRLMAHELFHRIQAGIHLPPSNPNNPHLDSLNGRLWIELEWRALGVALLSTGHAQDQAIQDAIAFRAHRQSLFPGSQESERSLDLNEGLAEYTGVAASAPDVPSAHWRAASRAISPGATDTFVRSFSYITGPAYGLLLDERLPNWRTHLTPTSDITTLLASTSTPLPPSDAEAHAIPYGIAALRISETERSIHAEAARAHYRTLFIDGPTLTLATTDHLNYSFDPNEVVPLGDAGTVHPTMQVTDDWGSLQAQQGVLLAPSHVVIAVPPSTTGAHITGPGYTLDLNPGWKIVPSSRSGSYELHYTP